MAPRTLRGDLCSASPTFWLREDLAPVSGLYNDRNRPIYDRLSELRAQLERLVLTHRWTLRETVRAPPTPFHSRMLTLIHIQDLYNFQMALQEIDSMRKDGKFVDSDGNRPEGQLVRRFT